MKQVAVLDVAKVKQKVWREKLKEMDDERLLKGVYEEK